MTFSWFRRHLQYGNGAVSIFVVFITIVVGTVFYLRGQELMRADIHNHVEALVLRASLLAEPHVLATIRKAEDAQMIDYAKIVQRLNVFRTENPEIRFIYILRPTKEINTFTFVADADSLHPFPPYYDLNHDGFIDASDELAPPGKPYDVSAQPEIQQALYEPTISAEPYSDQWGTYISAYAPIPGHDQYETLVIGIDIDIAKYKEMSKSLVTPSLLTLIFCLGIVLGIVVFIELAQKKLQSERRLESDRTILINLTTHQLGAPIATLRWWLEILRDRDRATFGEKDTIIDELETGMHRIEEIMKQLSTASTVASKHFTYNAEPTMMEHFLYDILRRTETMYQARQQTLQASIDSNLPTIRIDRKLIGGVIQEIIENASSYSKKGAIIVVKAYADEQWITLSVADNGIGIPKEDLPHITEKFRRAKNASSIKSVGTGLGLHIARTILEKAGGTLDITSTEGQGTTVTIKLPMR